MIMLDTSICIYVLKEHPAQVLSRFQQHETLHLSSIVCAELWSGIEKSPAKTRKARESQLLYFLSLLTVCDWDENAACVYARLHTDLQHRGLMIGNMDLLIAAHARSLDAILVSNNVREFSRIEGLRLENWAESD
ncbi:MAG TPA: type II toxin-antitoxin system VapC family toxin [Thiolinea sp.]|nr:type II toxin-antitoxin system VapC family toxin [Thiolinea sp.]